MSENRINTVTSASASESPTWLAVVNPHAGSGRTMPLWRQSEIIMRELGVKYRYVTTDCRQHATELVYEAAKQGQRHFIAAGGDGTIHEVVAGIMKFTEDFGGSHPLRDDRSLSERDDRSLSERKGVSLNDFWMGVIPIGSGNDWIRSHNIPNDIGKAVQLLADSSFGRQDVVKLSVSSGSGSPRVSYMANVAGIGFDARICDRVNHQKDAGKSGRLLYIKSFIYNFFRYQPMSVEIISDGSVLFSGDCFSIAFGIGKYSGGGFRQTPDAILDDGLFDITIIPAMSKPYIMTKAPKLFDGSLLSVPEVISAKAKSITVRPLYSAPELVEADGEIIGSVPVSLEIMPGQLNTTYLP